MNSSLTKNTLVDHTNNSAKPATFGPPAARHCFKVAGKRQLKNISIYFSSIAALLKSDNGDVGASLIVLVSLNTMLKLASAT